MLGALEASSNTVKWIEQGLADFNYVFSKNDNPFKQALRAADTSESMQLFLSWYNVDVLIYAFVSFWHAITIAIYGFFTANWIFSKVTSWATAYGTDVPINDGVRAMLFATVCGTIYYVSG